MGNPAASPCDRYEHLRRLFLTELHFNQVNAPLARNEWRDAASGALAGAPVLVATDGRDQDFQIIYCRLASDRLSLDQERRVVSHLLRNHRHALFVFSTQHRDRWHFLNVRHHEHGCRTAVFRRITVSAEERLRIAAERLAMLDIGDEQPTAPGLQALCDQIFDLETLQKQFFKAFTRLYHRVAADISSISGFRSQAGRLAQFLLDRLVSLYFIQKKGWLDRDPNYLYSRFLQCWKRGPRGASYYSDVLYPLFLRLSDPQSISENVGAVPFLKTGLFQHFDKRAEAGRLARSRLRIRNSTFKAIFDELLERFNFTVAEGTPLDVEVAIDPEMLGRIFEGLVLQLEKHPDRDLRKLTGSYYTPRPIVHFMCQEALKEYLATQLVRGHAVEVKSAKLKISKLTALPPAGQLDAQQIASLAEILPVDEARTLRDAVLDCRVCDPAVGSGAFPVGMLHEMVAVLARLDVRLHGRQALSRRNYEYDLKRQIIESCLHGVDLQEQAVRLSELRLWLSLVVDYQIDADKPFAVAIREIPRLPDLSHRLVHGDSLLGSDPLSSPNSPSFRWRVDFADVFRARGGFDIVLGNPPYLSARRFQDKKEDLAKYYVTPFGSYDIYVPFLELGIRLLNPGGVQCVITSNKFLLADYAAGLRRFLRESARIKMLVDLADCTRVFKALVSAAITLTIPGSMAAGDTLKLAILKGDEFTYINDEMFTERALSTLQKDSSDPFDIYVGSSSGKVIDKVQKDSIPLSRLGRVRTGIMGFDYWALERHIEDVKQPFNGRLVRAVTNSQVEPFRFLWGKSIRLYKQRFENPRIDIDCEPINASTREFFQTRKVIMRGVARRTTAAWDACGNALLVAVHGFVPQDGVDGHFITALLNSDLFDWLHRIRFYSARIPQGSLRYPVSFWESLPIKLGPRLLIEDISRMSRRMSSRMSRKSSMAPHMDTDALRQHLNRNIMALYEVTPEDLGSAE